MSVSKEIVAVINNKIQSSPDGIVLQGDDFGDPLFQKFLSDVLSVKSLVLEKPQVLKTQDDNIYCISADYAIGKQSKKASLSIDTKGQTTSISLRCDSKQSGYVDLAPLNWLSLAKPGFEYSLESEFGISRVNLFYSLQGDNGKAFDLVFTLLEGEQWQIQSSPESTLALDSVDDLIELSGLKHFNLSLPQKVQDIFAGVNVDYLSAKIDFADLTVDYFCINIDLQQASAVKDITLIPKIIVLDSIENIILTLENPGTTDKDLSSGYRCRVDAEFALGKEAIKLPVCSEVYVHSDASKANNSVELDWSIALQAGKTLSVSLDDLLGLVASNKITESLSGIVSSVPAVELLSFEVDTINARLENLTFSCALSEQWPIIPGYFSIDEVYFQLALENLSAATEAHSLSADIRGVFSISDDIELLCELDKQASGGDNSGDWVFKAGLAPDDSLDLNDIVAKYLTNGEAFPAGIPVTTIDNLDLLVNLSQQQFSFDAFVSDSWSPIPQFSIETRLSFFYSQANSDYHAALNATIFIGQFEFDIGAKLENSRGAVLTLSSGFESPIPAIGDQTSLEPAPEQETEPALSLGLLVEEILAIDLPKELNGLKSVVFDKPNISIDTRGQFSISCEIDFGSATKSIILAGKTVQAASLAFCLTNTETYLKIAGKNIDMGLGSESNCELSRFEIYFHLNKCDGDFVWELGGSIAADIFSAQFSIAASIKQDETGEESFTLNFPDPAQPNKSNVALSVLDASLLNVKEISLLLKPDDFDLTITSDVFGCELSLDVAYEKIKFANGSLSKQDGWHFSGQSNEDVHLSRMLNGMLGIFHITLPKGYPDIELSCLKLEFDTLAKNVCFEADLKEKMTLPLMSKGHVSEQVEAKLCIALTHDPDTNQHHFEWHAEADFEIEKIQFKLEYNMGVDTHSFKAEMDAGESLSLVGLLAAIGADIHDADSVHLPIDKYVDIHLQQIVLEYVGDTETLTLSAKSEYGDVFLVASKGAMGAATGVPAKGSWHFLFGVEFDIENHKLADIGGDKTLNDNLCAPLDLFPLKEFGFVIATGDFKNFELPAFPKHSNDIQAGGESKNKSMRSGINLQTQQGLSVFAVLDFQEIQPIEQPSDDQDDQDPHIQLNNSLSKLSTLLSDEKLIISIAYSVDMKAFVFMGILQGELSLPIGGAASMGFKNPFVELVFNGELTLEAGGTFELAFEDGAIDVTPRIMINESDLEGACAITITEDNPFPTPMGLGGVMVDEVGFELGITFEPFGIDMGLQGKSHLNGRPVNSDDFAFVFAVDAAGDIPIPNPMMLSFYIDTIDIETILSLLVPDEPAPILVKETLREEQRRLARNQQQKDDFKTCATLLGDPQIDDLSFCWSESVLTLPDGTVTQPGISFSGTTQFLGYGVHASLSVKVPSGIEGCYEMAPIYFPNQDDPDNAIASITGSGKGVYINKSDEGKGPRVQKRADTRGLDAHGQAKDSTDVYGTKNPQQVEIVKPGGPVFEIDTAQSPYINVGIKFSALGLLDYEVIALVDDKGMTFEIEYKLGEMEKCILDFTLDTDKGLSAKSDYQLYMGVDLEFPKEASLELPGIGSISLPSINIDAGFDIKMRFDIDEVGIKFGLLAQFDFEGDVKRFSIPAASDNKQIPALKDSDDFLKNMDLEKISFTSMEDIPAVLEKALEEQLVVLFSDLYDEAKKLIGDVKGDLKAIDKKLAADVKQIEQKAKADEEYIEGQAKQVVQEAGQVATEIAAQTKAIGQQAEKILLDAGKEETQIADAAIKVAGELNKEIIQIGEDIGAGIKQINAEIEAGEKEIVKELSQLATEAKAEVEDIGKAASKDVEAVLDAANQAVKSIASTAANVIRSINKDTTALLNAAQNLADQAAADLKSAGTAVVSTGKKIWHSLFG